MRSMGAMGARGPCAETTSGAAARRPDSAGIRLSPDEEESREVHTWTHVVQEYERYRKDKSLPELTLNGNNDYLPAPAPEYIMETIRKARDDHGVICLQRIVCIADCVETVKPAGGADRVAPTGAPAPGAPVGAHRSGRPGERPPSDDAVSRQIPDLPKTGGKGDLLRSVGLKLDALAKYSYTYI